MSAAVVIDALSVNIKTDIVTLLYKQNTNKIIYKKMSDWFKKLQKTLKSQIYQRIE